MAESQWPTQVVRALDTDERAAMQAALVYRSAALADIIAADNIYGELNAGGTSTASLRAAKATNDELLRMLADDEIRIEVGG